jgi:hypothetical protein
VWRLFSNRLTTKDNLLRHGVLNAQSILCIGGCGKFETGNHLFFECDSFGTIWYEVLHWFEISLVLSIGDVPHTTQFSGSYLFGKDVGLVSNLVCVLLVNLESV